MSPISLRNIAIIAHVDHGKTTLVDAMLRYTHAVREQAIPAGALIMDSMDLEREKGITIRAKNCSLRYRDSKINLVDTPGHADFGGEVERTLRMVDGALLLVDAGEGPMPQTKFVLRKAIGLGLPAIVVVNKIDRADAQVDDVVNRTFDLFVELNASSAQLDFPIVYTSATQGIATLDLSRPGVDVAPLFETILARIPPPTVLPDAPLQLLVLALAYDPFKGKMGIGKIHAGSLTRQQPILRLTADGRQQAGVVSAVLAYQGLERVEVEEAGCGEIVAVAGFDDVGIGDTLTDPDHPHALPSVVIEEPTLRMTFAVNKSPLAGREGKYVTSRMLRERLMAELEINVALRVAETDSADTFLVSGRGELHLAILIETMRREGYELEVSQPEVVYKEIEGQRCEPYEMLSLDVPSEYQGTIIEELGRRRAELQDMMPSPTGELHADYLITTRGLLGLKSLLLKKTRGTAIVHHVFDAYQPLVDNLPAQEPHGSLVATEGGVSSAYAITTAQERGELFIGPGVAVYEGMVVGQAARDRDIELNICRQKKLTNVRSETGETTIVLVPPREMTLELALEYLGADELLEVTPQSLRIRKRIADAKLRLRAKRATS
ncbi:MAG: GTP-binding protein TypA [Omnitrophica WOR_2 bacterium RIFCSPLOWO2_02_FULL_63_16]|nr:MAG: GTP-binding protein TypA [Omnitrophica WOR_2 bacterium GWA2_63_20]OGX17606.1 MAG: GTP-binding protein TypA [Omnitrophica WOR_2 bacterium GWF2_63_9]OGX36457.1 MAG: GTP-binding protein TypA [Omnitrophica WOR_2 bacterium RIFCSPHIGHO2_02_FULL_63_39]OGX44840.1 MAG: GTP-binding protein TypA [Omnitrophica WOR_2 bacterium RIFCSPLOWO2_02_FULL_63_16]OGX48071.1 MAG: GTP-binding protein TypA [Omnitrophica WOR_2 bacterium RIFCSPLOWO2_12_FULL_63_16]HAM41591.1 translational GTPase TypA [Candidatus Om